MSTDSQQDLIAKAADAEADRLLKDHPAPAHAMGVAVLALARIAAVAGIRKGLNVEHTVQAYRECVEAAVPVLAEAYGEMSGVLDRLNPAAAEAAGK